MASHLWPIHVAFSRDDPRHTRAGLESLKAAIDSALAGEEGRAGAMASDGEGYDVMVVMVNLVSAVGNPEYLIQSEDSARQREYDRAARQDIYRLGYPQKADVEPLAPPFKE